MDLKKHLMNEEYLHQEVLEEGIKYFKVSPQLFRLVDKLTNKVDLISNGNQHNALVNTTLKIQKLANKFKKLEESYSVKEITKAEKKQIKDEYKKLFTEYKEILKVAKNEDLKKALKTINQFGFFVLTMAIPLKFMAPVATAIGLDLNSTTFIDLLKRSAVYFGLGVPARFLGANAEKAIDKIINSRGARDSLEGNSYAAMKDKD